jgi:hypothetical protein
MTEILPAAPHPEEIRASAEFRLGPVMEASANVRITPAGLVSIGVMVAAILLSTAAIVRAARPR